MVPIQRGERGVNDTPQGVSGTQPAWPIHARLFAVFVVVRMEAMEAGMSAYRWWPAAFDYSLSRWSDMPGLVRVPVPQEADTAPAPRTAIVWEQTWSICRVKQWMGPAYRPWPLTWLTDRRPETPQQYKTHQTLANTTTNELHTRNKLCVCLSIPLAIHATTWGRADRSS